MILLNRPFERSSPSKDAKCIYIFCEGLRREFQYFSYFSELDSRINIIVNKLKSHDNTSPRGILQIAIAKMIPSEESPEPAFSFQDNDEIWLVVDFDDDREHTRVPQLKELREYCDHNRGWNLAISNPCFEVWLFYHICCQSQSKAELDKCITWKRLLNDAERGGFDSRKHPILIQDAQYIAEKNFKISSGFPDTGTTEVYNLAKSILPLLGEKLEVFRQNHT